MNVGQTVLGRTLLHRLIRMTFFKQFVAGETDVELRKCVGGLMSVNVKPILCVPIEEDSDQNRSAIFLFICNNILRKFRRVLKNLMPH